MEIDKILCATLPMQIRKNCLAKMAFHGYNNSMECFCPFFVKILKEYLKNAVGIAILYFIVIIRRRRRKKAPATPFVSILLH